MIDPGLKDKVVLVTGGNNPFGIGAAIARAFAAHGARIFVHYFRQEIDLSGPGKKDHRSQEPGLAFFYEQQQKAADEVVASIRKFGGIVEIPAHGVAFAGMLMEDLQIDLLRPPVLVRGSSSGNRFAAHSSYWALVGCHGIASLS